MASLKHDGSGSEDGHDISKPAAASNSYRTSQNPSDLLYQFADLVGGSGLTPFDSDASADIAVRYSKPFRLGGCNVVIVDITSSRDAETQIFDFRLLNAIASLLAVT